MNRILGLAALSMIGLVGCGDDGNDVPPPTFQLPAGTYVVSNSAISQDDCGFGLTPPALNGRQWELTLGTNQITLTDGATSLTLERSGDTLSRDQLGIEDYTGRVPPYDCKLAVQIVDDGEQTVDNEFDLAETYNLSVSEGTECDQAQTAPLPCTTAYSQHFALQ